MRTHYSLVYYGGLTVGLILDREIRRQSGGKRSLDDLMKWLYASFDRDKRRYGIEDLARGLDELGAGKYPHVPRTACKSPEVIPLNGLGALGMETLGSALLPSPTATYSAPHLAAADGLRWVIHRNPIHTGGFHRDRANAALLQPVG